MPHKPTATADPDDVTDAVIVEPAPPDLGTVDDVTDPTLMTDEDVVDAEVLPAVTTPEEQATSAHAAIEAAARAAIEQPGIPGRDEFLALAMQARMLAGSALCPRDLRGKPADVLLILLTGRDVGIPVTSALRKVYVVDGQPSLAPQLKLALVRRQGLGVVRKVAGSCAAWAGARAFGPDDKPLGDEPTVVTWHDAKLAGLAGVECYPDEIEVPQCDGVTGEALLDEHGVQRVVRQVVGETIVHSDVCLAPRGGNGGSAADYRNGVRVRCKDNWRSYPRRMLWWRAAGYEVDDQFPEVGLGLYSPDELDAMTDEHGRPISPATVALPPGFEQAERATANAERQANAEQGTPQGADAPADPAAIAALKARGNALPGPVRALLKERWAQTDTVRGFTMDQLPERLVKFVEAMMAGFEAVAKREHGWTPPAEGAQIAQEPAEGDAPVDGAESAQGAADANVGDLAGGEA